MTITAIGPCPDLLGYKRRMIVNSFMMVCLVLTHAIVAFTTRNGFYSATLIKKVNQEHSIRHQHEVTCKLCSVVIGAVAVAVVPVAAAAVLALTTKTASLVQL